MIVGIPPVVSRAIAAANAGDTPSFLTCFAPDGAVDDWGRVFTGAAEITAWSDAEFIGKHVVFAVRDATTSGNRTIVLADIGGEGYNGASTFTFTLRDDAIQLMRITA